MPNYTVKQGDCLSSIAAGHGLLWDKVWNHPKNSRLKEQRKDPNILYPGDVVFFPDKDNKEESAATEQRHRFRKKGTPAKLRLRLMRSPEDQQTEEPRQTIERGRGGRDLTINNEPPPEQKQLAIGFLCTKGTQMPQAIKEVQAFGSDCATRAAIDADILGMAEEQAGKVLKGLLIKIGYSDIEVKYREAIVPTVTCENWVNE